MCGGTHVRDGLGVKPKGLSPRVRGNRRDGHDQGGAIGSIPACAGEPRASRRRRSSAGVYPRVCGGTFHLFTPTAGLTGLSPRVRGNHRPRHDAIGLNGSIPACAGEPRAFMLSSEQVRVYPRVCGGTGSASARAAEVWGLSPRVRGNPRTCRPPRRRAGSIPACAGEPFRLAGMDTLRGVYPRVCGGTTTAISCTIECSGLSPRVRGNPSGRPDGRSLHGSIPACAGEPFADAASIQPRRVYPRVCGGTIRRRRIDSAQEGLSPRVRGNQLVMLDLIGTVGSIPACAGEPPAWRAHAPMTRVYPRVCGGTSCRMIVATSSSGLSPRVRGNRHVDGRGRGSRGSIPACAGEPPAPGCAAPRIRVYPRVCGGTAATRSQSSPFRGLSPRVRGNRNASLHFR